MIEIVDASLFDAKWGDKVPKSGLGRPRWQADKS